MPSGRDLSASGSGDCERGTDQDDTYLTLTTVEAAVTQRRYATAQRTPRMGPAVWAEVGEGMAASTAAEVMPSARTGRRPISRLRVLRAYPRCDQKTAIQFAADQRGCRPPGR